MVGVFLPGAAVGIYNLATVLTQALSIPSIALNTIYPPIAARMYSNNELEDLESLFTQVTRWSFTLSLLPAIGLIAYSEQLLAIFGEGFSRGELVLVLFAIGYFADAANGPTNYTLMMTDHQYLLMIDRWTVGISNAVLNYIFINRYGLIGAAFATGIILTTISAVRLVEIWYTEGLIPYSWKFLKPIAAGIACGVVLAGLEVLSPLTGIALMVVGGVVGTATYVLVLVALGIEPEDREFFADLGS